MAAEDPRHERTLFIVATLFSLYLRTSDLVGRDNWIPTMGSSAFLHWLRHTAATFDAPFRDIKDLQADLRHESMSTTQNTYYNSLDQNRAKSVKGLGIKDRG